jgi:hypothetical protein
MKKKNLFLLLTLLTSIFILLRPTKAQDTSITNYMPMAVGNVWIYSVSAMGPTCGCEKYIQTKIIGTVIKNARKYYLFQNIEKIIIGCSCSCINLPYDTNRVDSVSGNVNSYSVTGCSYSPFEIMIDSLRASLHDTIHFCFTSYPITCLNTDSVLMFGVRRAARGYGIVEFEGERIYKYVKDIGYASNFADGTWGSCNTTLLGCVINGVVYGDTSFALLSVNPVGTEIPKEYSLSQNYPNPFNPSTKIMFNIAPLLNQGGVAPKQVGDRVVTLKIYDLLGREVAILVNEQLKPGTYEVNFDGTNFSSGVYFYQLKADEFMDTKKLILMK